MFFFCSIFCDRFLPNQRQIPQHFLGVDVTIYTEKYVEDNTGTYYKLKAGTHTTVAVNMAMEKKD